ncbi:MAG: hypothetical protein ABI180_03095 [Microcoleus sp.]
MEINTLTYNPPLAAIELRLRSLLSAELYAAAWVYPSPATLMGVFEHLRTLRYILHDYPSPCPNLRPTRGRCATSSKQALCCSRIWQGLHRCWKLTRPWGARERIH